MVQRFDDFEIDDAARELRLRGREIPLQPRVFDLLSYLIRNRDRVVPKDELLDQLWPDVHVADGALQRAVSLSRSALRQGGLENAIRTHARTGYRFVAGVAEEESRNPSGPNAAIRAAREACERGAWDEACGRFADAGEDLAGPDLERWGRAVYAAGRAAEAVPHLERATSSYAAAGDRLGMARAALLLLQVHFEIREVPVARGWRGRAARLLQDQPETREHAVLACHSARLAMYEGDQAGALAHADRALELASRFEDPDLEVFALVTRGSTLLATGRLEEGLAAQDEAAAAVLAGGVDAWHGCYVFCGVISASVNRNDWARAAAWTEHFTRWCTRSASAGFAGVCQLHRAEVLTVQGDLNSAEREAQQAQGVLAAGAPWAEGDAFRVLGDIRLVRQDLDGAEAAFRRAQELGWDPQPGLALLQVARGRYPAALRALEQALEASDWVNGQRKAILLAHLVIVAQAASDTARAAAALEQLERRPEVAAVPAVAALVCRAQAEVAAGSGREGDALACLRRALQIYAEAQLPLPAAQARVRLAELLSRSGDADGAEIVLAGARELLERTGAPVLARG